MKHAIFSNSFCKKNNYFLAITFTLLFNFIINAQNKTNPWQFFIGINAVDTFPTGIAGDLFGADSDIDDDDILDKQDKCPEIPGLTIFGGCPDQDRDGIQDSEDDCPEIDCLIDNEGCPKMEEETIKRLQEFGQIIFFETNKDVLTKESSDSLEEVYSILFQYPIVQVIIEGLTDNVDDIDSNQLLSEKRANKVLGYLIERGIPSSKLKALGYDETRPIRTNSTSEGRSYNRRVEFKIRQ